MPNSNAIVEAHGQFIIKDENGKVVIYPTKEEAEAKVTEIELDAVVNARVDKYLDVIGAEGRSRIQRFKQIKAFCLFEDEQEAV